MRWAGYGGQRRAVVLCRILHCMCRSNSGDIEDSHCGKEQLDIAGPFFQK